MVTFLIRRAATLLVTLLVVSVLAFLIPYAGEGDPARKILRARVNDPGLDPAQVEALTRELGLDRPIYVQYLDWLREVATGDFGYSFTSRTPVQELVVPALSVSMSLALAALLLALVFALPLGTWAATRGEGGWTTRSPSCRRARSRRRSTGSARCSCWCSLGSWGGCRRVGGPG